MKKNYAGGFLKMDSLLSITKNGATGSQPCDLIAIKNNFARLIECKNLDNTSGRFDLNRIEANQWLSHKKYKECNNSAFELAVLWNGSVYFINFDLLKNFDKSIDLKLIQPDIVNFYGGVKNDT